MRKNKAVFKKVSNVNSKSINKTPPPQKSYLRNRYILFKFRCV